MNVLISTKPIIICLEAVLVCAMVRTAVSLSAAIPLGTSTKRADFASVRIFLKMPFQPCPLGCGYFLSSVDSHDRSLQCLGIQHAEAAFVDGLCVRSERVTMAALPSRLFLLRGNGGAPSVTARAGFSVIPSSLPSVVGRLGGRLTFPKWRVKLQCTCACKTPALGGIVIVSLPKYVSWRPLSRPKLTVLRAKPPLHAMAILRAHQAKGTKMHEGSTNLRLTQELRSATDLALRATEVTARSLRKAMSMLVVQERHLWLSLAERSDVDKVRFLDALISQAGLFGNIVEDCAQKFSAVQKQTEAIQHVLPRRDAPFATALWQG